MIRFVTCGFVTSLLAFFKLNAAQYDIHGFVVKASALEPFVALFGVLTCWFLISRIIRAINDDLKDNNYH